jgi:hypothetical protein
LTFAGMTEADEPPPPLRVARAAEAAPANVKSGIEGKVPGWRRSRGVRGEVCRLTVE